MNELNLYNNEIWKGLGFWRDQIKEAGVYDKLAFFNDVMVEKRPPNIDSGYNLVLKDINLDDKNCDIYHTDQDDLGKLIKGNHWHRIFIHIKD